MRKNRRGRVFWIVLILATVLSGLYFGKQITSQLRAYVTKARSVVITNNARPSSGISPKPQSVSESTGKFTFFPDGRTLWSWSVKYSNGRIFKLGDEFSSDCAPTVTSAKRPDTLHLEFDEQRSCNSTARKPISVNGESLKDINGNGSPQLVTRTLTGGNVYGHTSYLISLSANGPRAIRRLE
jgi:hypothetical protein